MPSYWQQDRPPPRTWGVIDTTTCHWCRTRIWRWGSDDPWRHGELPHREGTKPDGSPASILGHTGRLECTFTATGVIDDPVQRVEL